MLFKEVCNIYSFFKPNINISEVPWKFESLKKQLIMANKTHKKYGR